MKILQVSPTFPYPPNDGGKIVIYNFYKYISRLDIDVDFICLNKQNVNEEDIKHFNKNNPPEIFVDKQISSKLRIFRALLLRQSYLISKFFSKEFLQRLDAKLKEKRYDLIQFEGLHTALYALSIIARHDVKIIIRLQNLESVIIKRFLKNTKNPLLKIFFEYEYKKMMKLESKIFREIGNIAFITEEDKRISGIDNVKSANPIVNTAGVEKDYFIIKKVTNNDLLFLGSMDWKPNENAVIWFIDNVFGKILEEYPEIKFYVVGKNPSRKIIKRGCNNIIITGTVEDVRPYLEKTGICIVPLSIGSGMRVKILEFMSCGRPVISTSVGAEGINYHDGINLILADNEIEFIDKIRFLIKNPEEKEKIIENGKKLIENEYTWEKVIFEYKKYLSEVVI